MGTLAIRGAEWAVAFYDARVIEACKEVSMADMDQLWEQAREVILNRIVSQGESLHPTSALQLAEAYAWLTNVSQPHGANITVHSS